MQQGHYVVRAVVQVGDITLATGLSAAATVEQAEDQARSRALVVLGIESSGYAHLLDSDEALARLNPARLGEDLAFAVTEPQAWEDDPVPELAAPDLEPADLPAPATPKPRNGRRRAAKKAATTSPVDLSDIIAQTDVELKRLGWTNTRGRQYLEQTYSKRSRQQLTDDELLEFLQTLQGLSVDEPPF